MRNASTTRRQRSEADAIRAAMPNSGRHGKRGTVAISHPERIVFPGTGITKQDVADYYRAVAPWLLPEIARRPLSVIRCPGGAGGACFFQKHHADTLGSNVESVPLEEADGDKADYLYIEDERGLIELVQMNTLEFHPWGARIDQPDQPDRLVFDLDPDPGIDWKTLTAAAREVRQRLAGAGLDSFVRLSGGKGVHVVAPIRRGPDWDHAKAFCAAVAEAMAQEQPLRYVATASKAKRKGRIFIDWLRNARGATSVASWSLRAREGAPVAVPLRWEELGRTKGSADYDIARALRRARSLKAHPWGDFAALDQALPSLNALSGKARKA
ncbi:MAG: non-homologous end-joining DNA ligase [Xanthomonadales bacterium]|nr:non-homologous end-joining DNA ligase [Xanthomonadales bacterium]